MIPVVFSGNPFKIRGAVVCVIAVFMIYLPRISLHTNWSWWWPNESIANKSMDIHDFDFKNIRQTDKKTIVSSTTRLQDTSLPHPTVAARAGYPADRSQISDLVSTGSPWYFDPCFVHATIVHEMLLVST